MQHIEAKKALKSFLVHKHIYTIVIKIKYHSLLGVP